MLISRETFWTATEMRIFLSIELVVKKIQYKVNIYYMNWWTPHKFLFQPVVLRLEIEGFSGQMKVATSENLRSRNSFFKFENNEKSH